MYIDSYNGVVSKQNRSTEGCSKLKSPENKTCSGEICQNIRTLASPKVQQDQLSERVSVLCWHATPVANVLWKPPAIRKNSNSAIRSGSVTGSKIGVMPDRWMVSLYMVIIPNVCNIRERGPHIV